MSSFYLPGKTILTHSPMGLRIEFNAHQEGALELWISPRPTTSNHYKDRNFSNRDDHTRLFDKITFPGLTEKNFKETVYDPFHTVIRFEGQTLHLVPLVKSAAILLWGELPLIVDLKSDKQDTPLQRDARIFELQHPDRGELFRYAAVIGEGAGSFAHQLTLDQGRSTYARAELGADQKLILAGGVEGDEVSRTAVSLVGNPALLAENEEWVKAALKPGSFTLRDKPDWQRLMDSSRRVLLAMQDEQGAIRAALSRIYYLIWVRDGSIIEAFQAYAGKRGALEKWAEFLLANPSECPAPNEGKAFLMLVNHITKWEEDGLFYAVWAVFTAWTQSGDSKWLNESVTGLLREALLWKERYIFDEKEGLFGRYYRCETAFEGCRDNGFDNAVGVIMGKDQVMYEGRNIHRSYDLYINRFAHNSYLMLAAMDPVHAPEYRAKAAALEEKMKAWNQPTLPDYGLLKDSEGKTFLAPAYGLDGTDYIWACSIPPFSTEPWKDAVTQIQLLRNLVAKPAGTFLAGYFSLLQSIDPLDADPNELDAAIDYAARQCYRPGDFLAMPDTVVEMLNVTDGDIYHDVRPQAFSIGPWLSTLMGRGVRRLPFGVAVRGNQLLSKVNCYEYRNSTLDMEFKGVGSFAQLEINGKKVPSTLQIPDDLLTSGAVSVIVHSVDTAGEPVQLLSSSIRLLNVAQVAGQTIWNGEAFGTAWLRFRGEAGITFKVQDEAGNSIPFTVHQDNGSHWIRFEKTGPISIMH